MLIEWVGNAEWGSGWLKRDFGVWLKVQLGLWSKEISSLEKLTHSSLSTWPLKPSSSPDRFSNKLVDFPYLTQYLLPPTYYSS